MRSQTLTRLMSDPRMIRLRSFVRRIKPLHFLIVKLSAQRSYEDKFKTSILESVKRGDIVWDIGANVGFYTELFSEAIGDGGHVTAFEPSPRCFDELTRKFQGKPNVALYNAALGETVGQATFALDEDPLSPTSRVLSEAEKSAHSISVRMATADSYLDLGLVSPNLIKVDVEGFEVEVLKGMTHLLESESLRTLFIEIHFKIMESKGNPLGPSQVSQILSDHGYSVDWIDLSHLRASRVALQGI